MEKFNLIATQRFGVADWNTLNFQSQKCTNRSCNVSCLWFIKKIDKRTLRLECAGGTLLETVIRVVTLQTVLVQIIIKNRRLSRIFIRYFIFDASWHVYVYSICESRQNNSESSEVLHTVIFLWDDLNTFSN